ncbi:uncharacterized protein PpBr36_10113 [Pyricularia pennisetigena]|uniref:uncharacterized protein n=1 Tax=Pyricularia pennisetigena TaxID=1578925 RepID=UPI00114EE58B|nr:uncharacterized protein PpBr36_10113 [Pyricularia pennisetigena]TLS21603.1 hypothetical protein PpBr36_10113 [Pyricularia pennisetigena]
MALSRINGNEELYVGGVFALRRVQSLEEKNITHILSVIDYSLEKYQELRGKFQHMSIDIDDVEDADLLRHFPKLVRFIDGALHPPHGSEGDRRGNAVYVHCAMGKSRSVTAVCAYLMHKHPSRFGAAERSNPDRETAARVATQAAVDWVRQTREIAEPNDGFMKQLALWWEMDTPADADDAVERHPVYQRWLYKREVEESIRIGRAPDWVRFEDEESAKEDAATAGLDAAQSKVEMRCKKCRRVLTTQRFIVPHSPAHPTSHKTLPACPHVFVEPLSWMRPVLETGELDGRLTCPGAKCGASVGRYSWLGFKCSCGEWVCPAFSLQRSKVDEVAVAAASAARGAKPASDNVEDPRARLGIRMPPSLRENL